MRHAIDGRIVLQRPLLDLATVLDMTGLGFEMVRGALRSTEVGLSIETISSAPADVALTGQIDDAYLDAEEVLHRLALAMEADGIQFTLRLLDADGVARVTYESDR